MNMMTGLLGGSPDTSIKLNNANPTATGHRANAFATYRISNDKKVYLGSGTFPGFVPDNEGIFTEYETWCGAGPAASGYEVRATMLQQSGNNTYGSYGVSSFEGDTGAWLNLGTAREWTVRSYGPFGFGSFQDSNTISRTLSIEIRNASTLRRVAVATVVLTAQRY